MRLLAVFLFLLSACATVQTLPDGSKALVTTPSSDLSKLQANLVALKDIAKNDSIQATKLSVDGADPVGAQCYPGLNTFIQTVLPTPSATSEVTGLMTIHEKIRLQAMNVLAFGTSQDWMKLQAACGGLVQSDLEFRARFAAMISAIVASKGAIP